MNFITTILNIDKTIGTIKSKRVNVHNTWSSEYIEENVSPGTYKRAIIIATNVAEASLTLPSLRYVVETGYTKSNIYNENIRNIEYTTFNNSTKLFFESIYTNYLRNANIYKSEVYKIFKRYKDSIKLKGAGIPLYPNLIQYNSNYDFTNKDEYIKIIIQKEPIYDEKNIL